MSGSIIGNQPQIRSLYRHIVRAARAFPSIKRDKLVEEVRSEFRAHATETDPEELRTRFHLAFKGLDQLSMYTDLSKRRGDWSVNLDSNPMPRPATEEELAEDAAAAAAAAAAK
jgi:LYR motif-containing protein 4